MKTSLQPWGCPARCTQSQTRLLDREHLPTIPACLTGTPVMERSTLRSIANALHPVSPPQPFTLSMGRENPFSFCRSFQPVKDSPPLCPCYPGCLHKGRRARRVPGIHTGTAWPRTGPRSCRASPALPAAQKQVCKDLPMFLSYTLLNLPSNTSEASSGFSRQKHLLLWPGELLPAPHGSG